MPERNNLLSRDSKLLQSAHIVCFLVLLQGCSSTPKKEPELSEMKGKKVALIEIQGEESSRTIIEVALVNQLVQRGTFILLSEKEIEKAKQGDHKDVSVDPSDPVAVARKAGADFALRAKVLEFDANTSEKYSAIEEEDSQLEAETGIGKTKRTIKIKTLDAHFKAEVEFIPIDADKNDLPPGTRKGIAEASKTYQESSLKAAIHLPPKLKVLEEIANEAFHQFFERYN